MVVAVAVDLIASYPPGIEENDMQGLKIVPRGARDLAGRMRQAWRETLERSRSIES